MYLRGFVCAATGRNVKALTLWAAYALAGTPISQICAGTGYAVTLGSSRR
ncbi:MAG TPA: hypothetical protein VFQ68_17915 [Streptosporangiaceae bacterium]|nr:hypothetical protein [Streptosporangiaceae bacterium]